jgi:hypothetical protein
MATPPVKVLTPLMFNVPGPVRLRPAVPAMGAEIVGLKPEATVIAPPPTSVRPFPPLAATV